MTFRQNRYGTNEPSIWPALIIFAFSIGPACVVAEAAGSGYHAPYGETLESRGPRTAPVTILLFSDFESFQCARSAAVAAELLDQYPGVRLIFKHAPATTDPNAFLAHEAALAAGAQGKFWEMHDLLYEHLAGHSRTDLVGYARTLRLNLSSFQDALDRHTYHAVIENDLAEARGLGVTATPTFFVNGRRLVGMQGYASLAAVVDAVLSGMPSELRLDEQISAVAPTQGININLSRAPAKGPVNAPVSLVEFGDFECPFCAEMVPVLQQLLNAYPAEIHFAFKNYPLSIHRESPLAHEAALAAQEQGKFWEMHDLLFGGQDKLSRNDLIGKAKQLNLDIPRFTTELDAHRFKAAVDSDRKEGEKLGVDGTPFFFINGRAISGALSLAQLKQLIDVALKGVRPARAK